MNHETYITQNPFFALAHLSREQVLAMSEEALRELEQLVPPDYDPDAPVKKRVDQWLMREGGVNNMGNPESEQRIPPNGPGSGDGEPAEPMSPTPPQPQPNDGK
ncbi:hypothetical protein HY410_01315 [Candidatus Gottesmanbacteria bacterium]|nr:hypothetical protein [Candidatus Gottesmanbacteria bacterium]